MGEKNEEQATKPIRVLDELDVADLAESPFARSGTVLLHLRGEPVAVEFTTAEWEQARNAWRRKNPRPLPPFVEDYVRPDSPLGRQLKLEQPTFRRIYDERDAAFLAADEDWHDALNFAICAHALKLRLKVHGEVITDTEERAKRLRALGLQPLAAAGIVSRIANLSALAKAEAVGFTVGSSATPRSTPGDLSTQAIPSSGSKPHDSEA
jgi:hypothetical protein